MHILFCNYEYPPLGGGGGVVMADIAESLAVRHRVTVFTSGTEDLPTREHRSGVDVVRIPVNARNSKSVASLTSMATYVLRGWSNAPKILDGMSFDIVNTHFAVPTGPVGQRVANWQKVPNVLTLHGGDVFDPSKRLSPHRHASLRWSIRHLARNATVVTCNSSNTAENFTSHYSTSIQPLVIPLGIPHPPIVDDASRPRYGLSEQDFVLVTVGRLVARKQTAKLIALLAEIPDQSLKLVVVGDGPELADLKSYAAKLGVSHKVTFTGFVDNDAKQALLQMSDLYVSASMHEGFGLVFIEALAAGTPVVCFDHGGQTDFLETGVTGSLIPAGDFSALATCVSKFARGELCLPSPANCKSHASEYLIDRCAERYETLFQSVIGDR